MVFIQLSIDKEQYEGDFGGVCMWVTDTQLKQIKKMAIYNNMYLVVEYDYSEENKNA